MLSRKAAALALGLAAAAPAAAQDTVKIGVIVPYSGQFADAGNQLQAGIDLYMAEHGTEVAGRTVEIVRKDVGGIAPDVAKRLAQELVVRDEVDILAGFVLTPNALAAADIATEAERLMVVMNAATSIITEASPYVVRTSLTTPQINDALGRWVYDSGEREIYTIATDYGPGHDAQGAFERAFTESGGTVVGSDRTPVANPDFSAYVQRVRDAAPEAVYIWVPGGAQPAAIGKALAERGLTPENTRIIGQGELTHEEALASMGDAAIGIITGYHYTWERDDPINNAFVEAYRAAHDGRTPDIYSVGGYDGMHLIYQALEATGGDTSAEALVEAAKGMEWDSPRGPISIDPETRDIVQTIYIREVQKVGDALHNVIIEQVENVKDPIHGTQSD
jgi:branched-chain amino acid transport system substrate-binding protein